MGPVSFTVLLPDGRTWRRHGDHLRRRYSGGTRQEDEPDTVTREPSSSWQTPAAHPPSPVPPAAHPPPSVPPAAHPPPSVPPAAHPPPSVPPVAHPPPPVSPPAAHPPTPMPPAAQPPPPVLPAAHPPMPVSPRLIHHRCGGGQHRRQERGLV
ncbi:MAGE-like protein 2 [Portunus trituberculatus]|uniref:MAGE-like protein 2 n=1 Tax=Portunus trituberculatus TaxID=210409 RepID=UPI001E1CBB59|nr:MAGE-like protein 2 [Portunus trituberculatus]